MYSRVAATLRCQTRGGGQAGRQTGRQWAEGSVVCDVTKPVIGKHDTTLSACMPAGGVCPSPPTAAEEGGEKEARGEEGVEERG
ncbi:hypothetical protein E2C01_025543 [Portunus trituberculatus]|uniref:Uncharacterized protein n=1 Tax=Portunus trituberculatus TaxID=210409 RepID=A0A5B7EFU0_PORTR|nr:hypothetical protein [Portunus trituberculatus]